MQRASPELSYIYAAHGLTIHPVRGLNCDHHFPAAESALPAVDEPPADVPSSPCYHYFCVVAQVATSGRRLHFLALQHVQAMLCPQDMQ